MNMGTIIPADPVIYDKNMGREFNVHVLKPWLLHHHEGAAVGGGVDVTSYHQPNLRPKTR